MFTDHRERRAGHRSRRTKWVAALVGAAVLFCLPATANAVSRDAIEGDGSSWSANAVNQWVADVKPAGLRVVYTYPGSATGRKDFAAYNTDFAVSDIGYQGNDPKTGEADSSSRPYVYLPIVAGGTAFPYNLTVAGKRVTTLRLSGLTLAKIFSNQITDWSDPAVTRDNNGVALPKKPIIPVVHSEGAGSTAQFTQYLASMFPEQWTAVNDGNSKFTEYFPRKGNMVAQNGSDGVMNYIKSASGDGTIGYDEYSYALGAGFPVAKIKNANGYYTLPTQYNDAVALRSAIIDSDPKSPTYLLQNLEQVYRQKDDRTYPLSSYSYAIIPTAADDRRMTTAKRQTLADFLFYSVCGGQKEMGNVGYSPLPLNLVQASFDQIKKLKSADPAVDVTNTKPENCDNPTFVKSDPKRNHLAEIAPKPQLCDKDGYGPCGVPGAPGTGQGSNGGSTAVGGSGGSTGSASGHNSTGVAGGTGNTAGGGTTSGGVSNPTASGATRGGNNAGGVINANPDDPSGFTDGANNGGAGDVVASPQELSAYRQPGSVGAYAALAIAMLVGVIFLPALVGSRLFRGPGAGGR